MGKIKKPIMKDEEVLRAVAERTSIPFNTVFAVVAAYQAVIKMCIEEGVEARMGELGTMGWRIVKPKHDAVFFNMHDNVKTDPMDIPGYVLPSFKTKKAWVKNLREKTAFWDDEENGVDEDALQ